MPDQRYVPKNRGWIGALHEFSDWIPPFNVPRGWTDASWHNDACPRLILERDKNISCFVDYADKDDRETRGSRFVIFYDIEGIAEGTIVETDSIDIIIVFLANMADRIQI